MNLINKTFIKCFRLLIERLHLLLNYFVVVNFRKLLSNIILKEIITLQETKTINLMIFKSIKQKRILSIGQCILISIIYNYFKCEKYRSFFIKTKQR